MDVLEFQAPIFVDSTHELNEGFFVIANFIFNDPGDSSNFAPNILQNTALIRILNDDSKCRCVSKHGVYIPPLSGIII